MTNACIICTNAIELRHKSVTNLLTANFCIRGMHAVGESIVYRNIPHLSTHGDFACANFPECHLCTQEPQETGTGAQSRISAP